MLTTLFAQTSTPTSAPVESNPLMSFAPIVAIFIIFYFLVIRPQNKKMKDQQKQHLEMISGLKKGDQILMISGIYGTVEKMIDDETIEIEIAQGVNVTVLKEKIGRKIVTESKKPALKAKTERAPRKPKGE